ncbi:glycosyltransferase [Campylobacter sputorum]|uniref:glycosyltransferase n=1 Tax=Campylobacter sputorum TaxID=206 RepID=UPI000B781131|nr:glycosyltransferase [Campylobacter sputorum]ASM36784.1 glycosyltransferase, family 1 [Campylobacter sputorum bv. faecalis CCUG 20703]
MKICYFSCSNIFGGVENIILQTLNELCKNDEVSLILPKGAKFLDKFDKRVKIYEYKSYDKRYNPFLYMEVLKIIKNYDIIHTHGSKTTQICYILSKFCDFKFVSTKHNDRKGKIFNRVKNVIAVSNKVARSIKNRSKIIYFGIKAKNVTPNLPQKFTITAVGRLDFIKGFDILINEASKLKFDFILQIVGSGKEKDSLEKLINELNLNQKVKLLGHRDDIAEILANSHLQVISSRKEGFPLILIEGLFYSNVLISSKVGGIDEVLNCEFFYENLSEKIDEIHKNYEIYRAKFRDLHKNARKNLDFYNYISNLKEYYKGIL